MIVNLPSKKSCIGIAAAWLSPTGTIIDIKKRSRNTLEETYAQIVVDMTEAEKLLPSINDIFLNKIAASGFLSRVHLQMGNYGKALESIQVSDQDGSRYTS